MPGRPNSRGCLSLNYTPDPNKAPKSHEVRQEFKPVLSPGDPIVDPRAWITSREGATPKVWSVVVEIEVDPRAWITSREGATPKAWSVIS